MDNLWKLELTDPNNGGTKLIPVLTRTGTKGQISGSIYTTSPIDVVSDFQWTKNPKQARDDVPAIFLTEKRISVNSNISNLANSTFAIAGSDTVSTTLAGAVATTFAAARLFTNPYLIAGSVIAGAVIASTLKETVEFAFDQVQKLTGTALTFDDPILKPYNYLYITQPTWFVYKLPYFDNSYVDNSLTFGGADQNLLGDATNIIGNIAAGLAGGTNIIKPGTYIETSQQFAMADKGRTINIKFPLLNTGSVEDIQQNWQLLFGLIYQNRPGRETRSIIDLPVIYEVTLPGVVYMPYAYISSLSIKFLGSRRLLKIQPPIDGIPPFDTIIPDAYEVNITIQGLNDETKNFIYTAIAGGSNSRVTTSISTAAPTNPGVTRTAG